MLRITPSKNADGAMKYFTQGLSKEDYYTDEKEVKGIWQGILKEKLNLPNQVDKATFKKIINNRSPNDTKLTPRDKKNRRPGYDFTFNAPKSVSIVYSLTQDSDILKAQQLAVAEAMAEVEQHMQTQSGQGKNKHYQTTGNVLSARFDHFTARPVQDKNEAPPIPDPHLHSHNFVFNVTWNDDKDRYQAIELGTIKREAPYYEAIYHTSLIKQLRKVGYDIEVQNRFWEIKGVERETIEKFSRRTKEIEKVISEKNITWDAYKGQVGSKTRLKKDNQLTTEQLRRKWLERLTVEEHDTIMSLKNKQASKGDETSSKEKHEQAIDRAIQHHFERKSVVSEKRVLARAISQNYGQVNPTSVKDTLKNRKDVIYAEKNGNRMITTREMMKQENDLISYASKSRNKFTAIHNNYKIKKDILNEQQRQAIQHILRSKDQVMIVSGGAGTGKTSLLQEVKTAHEEQKKSLFAFAPSADASRGVLREKGFRHANTVAYLLADERDHEKLKNQTILIDEAGMVSLRNMNQIFTIAKKQNARVILSGDWKQHHAVQAGDALRLLDQRALLPVARVNEVVRQRDNKKYKRAIEELAKGKTEKGFHLLDKMGAIKEVPNQKQRHQEIVTEYAKSIKTKRTAIVVSPTHKEGKTISESIRNKLKQDGHIDKDDHAFDVLQALHLTEAEKQDARNYKKGQVLQFHQNIKGIKAGYKYEIETVSPEKGITIKKQGETQSVNLPFSFHKRYQVYQKEIANLAKGDVIRITRNGYTVDKTRLNNGQMLKVDGINKDGQIRLSNGRLLSKDFQNFSLGYYRTSHSSQGKDAQDVFLVQSSQSFAASNEKQFYVSASRGEQRCFIYTDDKQGLYDAVKKTSSRLSAKELIDHHIQEQRIKRAYKAINANNGKQEKSKYRGTKKQMAQPKDAPTKFKL